MCRRVDKRIDDLQLFDDRAGPSVVDDERQRVVMFRTDVNEVDVDPIDCGGELREGVELRLALAPVVVRHPIAGELLNHCERHALGLICDGLLLGPVRGRDTSTEVIQGLIRNVDAEGMDLAGGLGGATHDNLRCWWVPDQRSDLNAARTSVVKKPGAMPCNRRAGTGVASPPSVEHPGPSQVCRRAVVYVVSPPPVRSDLGTQRSRVQVSPTRLVEAVVRGRLFPRPGLGGSAGDLPR